MSLTQALGAAISGLRVTQSGLALVAGNVANADTPGYVRKAQTQVATSAGDSVGVRVSSIDRQLDVYIQRQLQVETSGGAYAGTRADFYSRLQQIYGQPGGDNALETVYNNFTTALQGLNTSPDSSAIRGSVVGSAQALAQQLNSVTNDLQSLRTDTELSLGDAVNKASEAMRQIAVINQQLGSSGASDATTSVLIDQRDNYINQLSELMDVRVISADHNQVSVFTNSGVQLVGAEAAKLSFDAKGVLSPQSQWSADPNQRTTGTITLVSPTGGSIDLLATNAIRSGKIAAYAEMRDQILPQAQAQLDQLAAAMSSALSDRTVAGTAVVGPPAGFDVDVGSLQAGNRVNVTYTDTATGAAHNVTIVRVDDPNALPLPTSADPKVVGVDFSGGPASVASQLNTALAAIGLQFSNPAGNTLRVMDDGGTNTIDVSSASATSTVTSLTAGTPEFPFFLDATTPYTGTITSAGPQSVGLAGRLVVNPAIVADPSRLVVYQTSPLTASGDLTRPNFIYSQLTSTNAAFAPQAGIGSVGSPFKGSIPSYLREMISQQGAAAESANSLKQGQDVVVNSLQQRFNDEAGVNVDSEMANLLQLQSAYAANARVMTTVRDLLDLLMKM
jgi:flagellar hook-associated protein 1 FlgK